MSPKDLVLFGITGGRVAVLGVLLAPLFEILPEDQIDELFDRLAPILKMGVLVVAAIVVLFLLASAIISVIATVLTFWNFTLTWESGRLLITKGLLETRRTLIPLKRVQAVQLRENLVRRIFRLASVKVLVAGFGREQDQGGESSTLLPIGPRASALSLVAEILACDDLANVALTPAPRRALVRRFMYVLIAALVFVPAGVAIAGDGGLIGGGIALAAGAFAFAGWTQLGHTVVAGHLVVRSGFLLRRTTFVPVDKVQRLSLWVTPSQRLTALASLRMGIAGSQGGLTGADLDMKLAGLRFRDLSEIMTGAGSISEVPPAIEGAQ
jgi:putative membrane protein